ncbi:hypothetical protein Pmani_014200 [Petrolisthes manimaculis]|uniref:RNA-directed DNA polymerase n=1 Tax=Petrolisthes manimaculis TaxID=1843537 RepID=A0AAE1UCU7_9EUCA|nr:hypothetical protein Pmani_014200 [Petrolisthes manimaculis]
MSTTMMQPPHFTQWGMLGSYIVNDKPLLKCVELESVRTKVTVRGFVAQVRATLIYHNLSPNPLQVKCVFPVEDGAAFYKFEARLDGRTIIAQCMEKKKTFDQELKRLSEVFNRIRAAHLKLNPKKCHLFQKEVKYLKHIVDENGIHTDPEKVSAVRDWPTPTCVKDLWSFLDLCTYYRCFVKEFASIATPLHKLLGKRQKFKWTAVTQKAIDELKQVLVSSPVLTYPDQSQPFILDCDASCHGIGGDLSQEKGDQEYVVAYYSKKLSPPEGKYCVTCKELLAVVKSLDFIHPYLYGSYFIIRMDHAALKWLKTLKNPEGQLAHGNADSLSRRSCEPEYKQCSKKEDHSKMCNRTAVTGLVSAEEDLVRMQVEDADLKLVIEWLQQSTERPSWQEVSSGHLGVKKNLSRLRQRFYWMGMRQDVEEWCWAYDVCCAKKGPKKRGCAPLQLYQVGAPVDIAEPLPRTDKGNRYIFVVMDYFTKWPEAYAILDQEAATCCSKKVYKDAVSEGKTAVLAREHENTSDILQLALGNLPSGERAEIEVSLVMELCVRTDGGVSFILPTVLNPRYSPADLVQKDSAGMSWNYLSEQRTVCVTKAYSMDIEGSVCGSHQIARIISHTDPINVTISDDTKSAQITQDGGFKCDHDWSMTVYYNNPYKTHVLRETSDRSGVGIMTQHLLMINFFPSLPDHSYSNRNEIIFVIDRSGSMNGSNIRSARTTLLLFLKSLPQGCYFNIVSFGSHFEALFPNGSLQYTEGTLKEAVKLQETMEADMGGTEILNPLKSIYSNPPKPEYSRQILLISDGSVFNVSQVTELVARNSYDTRVFSVGIGQGASTSLIHGVARAGRGRYEMVVDQDKLQHKVMGLVRSMLQESVQGVSVTCRVEPATNVSLVPKAPPVIFAGQHLILYARVTPDTKVCEITVKGSTESGGEVNASVDEDNIVLVHDEEMSLHRLAARAQINQWKLCGDDDVGDDMVDLSVASSVVSPRTAFIGVDQESRHIQPYLEMEQMRSMEEESTYNYYPSYSAGVGTHTFDLSTLFPTGMSQQSGGSLMRAMTPMHRGMRCSMPGGMPRGMLCPMPSLSCDQKMGTLRDVRKKRMLPMPTSGSNINQITTSKYRMSGGSAGFKRGLRGQLPMSLRSPGASITWDSGRFTPSTYCPGASTNLNPDLGGGGSSGVLKIVELQRFDGSWSLDAAATISGVPLDRLKAANTAKSESVFGTAVVLAVLEKHYNDDRDQWILLATKAGHYITNAGHDKHTLLTLAHSLIKEAHSH